LIYISCAFPSSWCLPSSGRGRHVQAREGTA
jgi:hypothetical protein